MTESFDLDPSFASLCADLRRSLFTPTPSKSNARSRTDRSAAYVDGRHGLNVRIAGVEAGAASALGSLAGAVDGANAAAGSNDHRVVVGLGNQSGVRVGHGLNVEGAGSAEECESR